MCSLTPGSTTRVDPKRRLLLSLAAVVFWLTVWEVVSLLVGQELLVPSPVLVLATLGDLARTAVFWQAVGWSLLRVLAGFAAGVLVGCCAAVLTTRWSIADALLSPMLRVVRAAPVASFIILALVWTPTGRLPGVISFLMVVPVVWDSIAAGIGKQDRDLDEMAVVFRFGSWQRFRRVRVPQLAPFFAAACSTGMGLAWKSGVAAEVISRPETSIGGSLQDAKVYLDTPAVFSWTITVVALSMLLEWLLRRAGNHFVRAEGPARRRRGVNAAL